MSIHCDWLVLCHRVIEDSLTRQLSLIDVLDQLWSPLFPAEAPGFAFAAYLSRGSVADAGRWQFRLVRISDEDGEEEVFLGDADWPSEVERLRVFVNFAVLRLHRAEAIRFRLDWRREGRRWTHGPAVPLQIAALPTNDSAGS